MKRLCAWCKKEITESEDRQWSSAAVTHGICAPCLGALRERTSIPLPEFLAALEAFVVLVEPEDHTVRAVDEEALRGVWDPAGPEPTRTIGEVFECAHATLPGGCGYTIHCSGCAIRRAVQHTSTTGETLVNVPATLRALRDPEPEDVELLISTTRRGDRVLLSVREAIE